MLGNTLPPPEVGRLELDMLVLMLDERVELTGMDFVRAGVAKGSVYTVLGRLEGKGFVRRIEPGKRYRITKLGARVVRLCENWWAMQRWPGARELVPLRSESEA